MKQLILSLSMLLCVTAALGQTYQVVKAKNAKKYLGKEIIVCGKLCSFANSSYVQTAWYYLGRDTAHKELTVVVQGKIYGIGGIWVGKYVGRKVLIKGIVRDNHGLYLEATDTLRSP